ncbi:MAG: recombinase family protein [Burkholderiaceae bacterium]|nr:recombinase family protein [Burkholderiaceae bacterium]
MTVYGYARVSTTHQENHLQIDALTRAGATIIIEEKASGVRSRRELSALLAKLRRGDCILVYKLDRFARSLLDLLSIIAKIEAVGANFRSLTESVDTSSPAGRMMLQMFGAFAEFERNIIRERSIAGQKAARDRGHLPGRPRSLTAEQEAEAVRLYLSGVHTLHGLSVRFGVSSSAIKRAVYRVTRPNSTSLG